MTIFVSIPDIATAEEAASLVALLASQLGLQGDTPDVRTLRLWRTKKQITVEGRNFSRRNILEILVIHKLRQEGRTLQYAVERTFALDEDRLRLLLTDTASPSSSHVPVEPEPIITLQLLATGIIEQFQLVKKGAIVGHTDQHKTGVDNMPLSLQQAMARLGRHYFAEGKEDKAASIHQLLTLCTLPLHKWAPTALGSIEQYRDAILIDPDYRVPNEDCDAIVEEANSTDLHDLIEHHLHERLRTALMKLGQDADVGYSIVREFIGRHPMATRIELQQLFLNPELTNEVIDLVRSLYSLVHAGYTINGTVQRCSYCRALIIEDGACLLAGCRHDHPIPLHDEQIIPADGAFLARPEVLKYWVDPAREELRMYDTLRVDKQLRDQIGLYPHSDRCDVAIGEEVGVDIKDYQDPVRLARRLNRSIGGLSSYPTRILAIAQRRWSTTYHDRLLEQLSRKRRAALQVMSVNQTIAYLKKTYGGGRHASDA